IGVKAVAGETGDAQQQDDQCGRDLVLKSQPKHLRFDSGISGRRWERRHDSRLHSAMRAARASSYAMRKIFVQTRQCWRSDELRFNGGMLAGPDLPTPLALDVDISEGKSQLDY